MVLETPSRKFPKRYILCLMSFSGLAIKFILYSSLSIAIVAMVKQDTADLAMNSSSSSSTGFDWDSRAQGYLLSAFFYGQTLVQIPVGFLSTKFGGKMITGVGLGSCGFFSLLIPACAHLGIIPLIILRFLQGMTGGSCLPAVYTLWSKWSPAQDRSILLTFSYAGGSVGQIIAMILGGFIAGYWSWEWIFYLTGLLTLLWTAVWFSQVHESPSTHPTITNEELIYIESDVDGSAIRNDSIPWRAILTSLPVWAIIVAHFGANWLIYLFVAELPTLLALALHYNVEQSGVLASIPYIWVALTTCIGGWFADWLRKSHSTSFVRKIIITIASIGTSLSLLLLTLLPADQRRWILVSISLAMGSTGLSVATFSVNQLDVSGHFAGVLMGLSNCIASIPGFIVPTLTGHVVRNGHLKSQWNIIFVISICICLLAAMFYILFGAGELQPWVEPGDEGRPFALNKSASSPNSIDRLTDSVRAELKAETSAEK